jgi:phage repressor protein C with HTH and peptisase S24 domain
MVIYIGEEEIRDGDIYVLNVDDDTLVKQVQLDPSGALLLISKNPTFPPRPVSRTAREQLSFAGRLVMTMKRFA